MIFRKTLYILKYIGTVFHMYLSETLHDVGLLSNKADPEVWYRPAVKPNGFE